MQTLTCWTAGTVSRSVTQVLVLLREVVLFAGRAERAGRWLRVACLMLGCGHVQVSGGKEECLLSGFCRLYFKAQQDELLGVEAK